jgi:hypothetical protein
VELKRYLTPDNMQLLWTHPWADWMGDFLFVRKHPVPRLTPSIVEMARHMLLFDMNRPNSAIVKSNGAMCDVTEMELLLVDIALQHLIKSPILDPKHANDVLKCLLIMHKHLDTYLPGTSAMYSSFALCINTIALHNTFDIRVFMKNVGLFSIREACILKLLKMDLDTDGYVFILGNFSFDILAEQRSFKEANGILLLLRIFHRAERPVQQLVLSILVRSFCSSSEHWRSIKKLVDDTAVAHKLQSVISKGRTNSFDQTSMDIGTESASHTNSALSVDVSTPITVDEFIEWYFGADPERVLSKSVIEQRIETQYLPIAAQVAREQERLQARRNKRINAHKDKQLRASSLINRSLVDIQAKGKVSVTRRTLAYRERLQLQQAMRQERLQLANSVLHSDTIV